MARDLNTQCFNVSRDINAFGHKRKWAFVAVRCNKNKNRMLGVQDLFNETIKKSIDRRFATDRPAVT